MKQPINRILMLRTRGFAGPLFQKVGNGLFMHSSGAAISAKTVTPAPNLGFTMWDDGETFWDVDTRSGEPATTWDRRR